MKPWNRLNAESPVSGISYNRSSGRYVMARKEISDGESVVRSNSAGLAADSIRFCSDGLLTKCGANASKHINSESKGVGLPILLMADFKAMEWRSPAGPPTVCDFDIDGVGVDEE